MKVFIDIGHPAHVHYFKYLIRKLLEIGHNVVITARDKEMTHELLQKENLEYISRGKGAQSLAGKFIYLLKADWQLCRIAMREKPDLYLGFASPYCAHAAWLMGKPCLILDDTETAGFNHRLYRPFATKILTPKSFRKDFGSKHVQFPSFMELSYLHPKRFLPDKGIYQELGINEGKKFVLLRFVSLKANHDVGLKGISIDNRKKAIHEFSKFARVFISSESKLPEEFREYKLPAASERIHDVIAYASLVYGESATMSSEAAVLGTPAIFVNNVASQLGTISDQSEKYGLISIYTESESDQKASIKKGVEILKKNSNGWPQKKKQLLDNNIDLTEYLLNFVTNNETNIG